MGHQLAGPRALPVRIALFGLMLAGLLLSASIPQAFGNRGLVFAGAYVFMQVGRTLFFLWAVRGVNARCVSNFQRILVWLLLSSVFWIVGGIAAGEARLAWWTLALLVEFVSPLVYFWVPGLGRSTTSRLGHRWRAPGGALRAVHHHRPGGVAAGHRRDVRGTAVERVHGIGFSSAVVGTIVMWWLYFDTGAHARQHRMTHSSDPGRHGAQRVHLPALPDRRRDHRLRGGRRSRAMHPHHAEAGAMVAILGGPACYLTGTALFKWSTNLRRTPPLSHMAGLLLLAILAAAAAPLHLSPLAAGVGTTAVLVIVAIWESIAIRRPPRSMSEGGMTPH